jgi:hypothetical protein
LGSPSASQELGEILRSVAQSMLTDVKGWGTVSRTKVVEP